MGDYLKGGRVRSTESPRDDKNETRETPSRSPSSKSEIPPDDSSDPSFANLFLSRRSSVMPTPKIETHILDVESPSATIHRKKEGGGILYYPPENVAEYLDSTLVPAVSGDKAHDVEGAKFYEPGDFNGVFFPNTGAGTSISSTSTSSTGGAIFYCAFCMRNRPGIARRRFEGNGGCSHEFCTECLNNYLFQRIRVGHHSLHPCPKLGEQGCRASASNEDVRGIVRPELYEEHCRRVQGLSGPCEVCGMKRERLSSTQQPPVASPEAADNSCHSCGSSPTRGVWPGSPRRLHGNKDGHPPDNTSGPRKLRPARAVRPTGNKGTSPLPPPPLRVPAACEEEGATRRRCPTCGFRQDSRSSIHSSSRRDDANGTRCSGGGGGDSRIGLGDTSTKMKKNINNLVACAACRNIWCCLCGRCVDVVGGDGKGRVGRGYGKPSGQRGQGGFPQRRPGGGGEETDGGKPEGVGNADIGAGRHYSWWNVLGCPGARRTNPEVWNGELLFFYRALVASIVVLAGPVFLVLRGVFWSAGTLLSPFCFAFSGASRGRWWPVILGYKFGELNAGVGAIMSLPGVVFFCLAVILSLVITVAWLPLGLLVAAARLLAGSCPGHLGDASPSPIATRQKGTTAAETVKPATATTTTATTTTTAVTNGLAIAILPARMLYSYLGAWCGDSYDCGTNQGGDQEGRNGNSLQCNAGASFEITPEPMLPPALKEAGRGNQTPLTSKASNLPLHTTHEGGCNGVADSSTASISGDGDGGENKGHEAGDEEEAQQQANHQGQSSGRTTPPGSAAADVAAV